MALDPWYKIVTPRKEVREGRSFNPDEFAIALEQIVWFEEMIGPEEVGFEKGVFLLLKGKAKGLKGGAPAPGPTVPTPGPEPMPPTGPETEPGPAPTPGPETLVIHVKGTIPPELGNRLGTRILPKLRSGTDLKVGVEFTVTIDSGASASVIADLKQILKELGVADSITVTR